MPASAARMAAASGWRRSITSSPRCWSGHTSRAAICEARRNSDSVKLACFSRGRKRDARQSGVYRARQYGRAYGAQSGEVSIIVGGAPETYAACEDLFRAMGKNLFHVGALGHGLAMKLLNNMLGQIQTVAIAEALVYGVKAGLDPQKIYEVIRVSTGSSVQFENRVPRMLKRDFTPGGTIDISYKDQELETAFAKRLGVPLLLANVSQQVYQMARAQGLNKEDGSAIIKLFEKLAGVTVGGGDDRRSSGFD